MKNLTSLLTVLVVIALSGLAISCGDATLPDEMTQTTLNSQEEIPQTLNKSSTYGCWETLCHCTFYIANGVCEYKSCETFWDATCKNTSNR